MGKGQPVTGLPLFTIYSFYSFSRTAKTSTTTDCGRKFFFQMKLCLFYFCEHQLSYSIPSRNFERLFPMVYQYNLDLTSIVTVYCPWGIQNCNPISESQATSRPNLALVTARDLHEKSRTNSLPFSWLKDTLFSSHDVHSRGTFSGIFRKRKVFVFFAPTDVNRDLILLHN